MKISILILTKNEENDLPQCLASVSWCDDIWVFDSMSTDRTIDIAKAAGANVVFRAFDDWSSHQNWGLRNIAFENPWILYIDADERVSELLRQEIEGLVEPSVAAFRISRRDFMGGRWLKHVQASPKFVRLFRPEFIHYERLVNPVTVVDGQTSDMKGWINHYPFSKGLSHWLARHNSYSSFEAEQVSRDLKQTHASLVWKHLFDLDFGKRRRAQKAFFYMLPGRPIIKFLLLYVLRGGFLDGSPGFRYAVLQSIYEYFIVLKTLEIRQDGPPS